MQNKNQNNTFNLINQQIHNQFAYPNSEKVYIKGSRADIQVPYRKIYLDDTVTDKATIKNPPIPVYDTSGIYSDPAQKIDLKKELPLIRQQWIADRNDTQQLIGLSSEFGQERIKDPKTAHLRFAHIKQPLSAKPGYNVTQMCIMHVKVSSLLKWSM